MLGTAEDMSLVVEVAAFAPVPVRAAGRMVDWAYKHSWAVVVVPDYAEGGRAEPS